MWKLVPVAVVFLGAPWIVAVLAKYAIAGACALVLIALVIVYMLEERC